MLFKRRTKSIHTINKKLGLGPLLNHLPCEIFEDRGSILFIDFLLSISYGAWHIVNMQSMLVEWNCLNLICQGTYQLSDLWLCHMFWQLCKFLTIGWMPVLSTELISEPMKNEMALKHKRKRNYINSNNWYIIIIILVYNNNNSDLKFTK